MKTKISKERERTSHVGVFIELTKLLIPYLLQYTTESKKKIPAYRQSTVIILLRNIGKPELTTSLTSNKVVTTLHGKCYEYIMTSRYILVRHRPTKQSAFNFFFSPEKK